MTVTYCGQKIIHNVHKQIHVHVNQSDYTKKKNIVAIFKLWKFV